jgi:hypothetical protein
MSFTVPRDDLRARARARPDRRRARHRRDRDRPEMGKVSLVGAGMKSHPGVAAKVFSTLGDEGINIEMISTSPIKISCVVRADDVDRAVRALHRRSSSAPGASRPRTRSGDHRPHEPTASPSSAPPAPSAPSCSPSCASAASRPTRSSRSPPSARRAASSTARLVVQALPTTRSRASTSRCSRRRLDLAASGRRASSTPAPSWSTTPLLAHDDDVPLVVAEVNPRRSTATRASSPTRTARRCRWWSRSSRSTTRPASSGCRLDLPVGVGHRAEGGRGARRPDAHLLHGRSPPRRGLSAPDRVQRAAAAEQLQGRRRLHTTRSAR